MARVSHLVVDGLAFVMIGVGLTVAYVGSDRKLTIPARQQQTLAAGGFEPITTGAIADKLHRVVSKPPITHSEHAAEVASPWSSTTRVWADPPRR
jgi:hypothetical protein